MLIFHHYFQCGAKLIITFNPCVAFPNIFPRNTTGTPTIKKYYSIYLTENVIINCYDQTLITIAKVIGNNDGVHLFSYACVATSGQPQLHPNIEGTTLIISLYEANTMFLWQNS